jgi:ubiquinone/menaquinone biosynthesis C-methylase UbiE
MMKTPAQVESEDVQSFERRSSTYEDSFLFNYFFDWIQRIALAAVPFELEPANILDIGCGTGRLLRKAARRWPAARLTGVDPAEGMLKAARRLTPRAQFQLSLAETLPLPDRSFDLVLSTMSFHHWQNQAQGVRQASRVLHPGGAFVLLDISLPLGLEKVFPHGREASPAMVRKMFDEAGLEIHSQHKVMANFLLLTIGKRIR